MSATRSLFSTSASALSVEVAFPVVVEGRGVVIGILTGVVGCVTRMGLLRGGGVFLFFVVDVVVGSDLWAETRVIYGSYTFLTSILEMSRSTEIKTEILGVV